MQSKNEIHSKITENVVYFARTLRKAGLPVGPGSVLDAITALEISGIESRQDLYWTLQAVFVQKREHRILFDEAFRLYWQSRGLVEKMLSILSPVAPPRADAQKARAGQTRISQAFEAQKERAIQENKPQIDIDAKFTVSGKELLQNKDFAQMTTEEIEEAKRALRDMVLPSDRIKTRRKESAHKGQIDFRRSLSASLKNGGDAISLQFRRRKERHPPLVILCDISGSMSQYSRLLLHFVHATMAHRRDVYAFVFGTRLSNITRQLKMKDPDEALEACSEGVEDWSGGTRIATALHKFNRHWSRRVLSGGPTVLLITDGLERDTDEDLSREMERLHLSCRRLIWLNPLLRFEGFEAKAKGIRTMLSHVDEFRTIHSLKSVQDLVSALNESAKQPTSKKPKHWLRTEKANFNSAPSN